ncbi:hypothetical protein [Bacillus sp. EB600]|uniref:hypothetical protein n=1 Tax=Bacillus sp. EB600 TaxID=2806345 RepID=UPI00210DB067|nr:hypothetical protein [Bacillus sp. EB600]MCQ6282528.1 hypothetical protein [Bacillus sp. EB600]
MLIDADAFRTDGLITVILLGQLPTQCDEAAEVGSFPGTVMDFANPCSARIFVREGRKPGRENMYCALGLGNIWSINRVIPDKYSKSVEIFINDHLVRKIRVVELTVKGMYNTIL